MSDSTVWALFGTSALIVGMVMLGIAWRLCNDALGHLDRARRHLETAQRLINSGPSHRDDEGRSGAQEEGSHV